MAESIKRQAAELGIDGKDFTPIQRRALLETLTKAQLEAFLKGAAKRSWKLTEFNREKLRRESKRRQKNDRNYG